MDILYYRGGLLKLKVCLKRHAIYPPRSSSEKYKRVKLTIFPITMGNYLLWFS